LATRTSFEPSGQRGPRARSPNTPRGSSRTASLWSSITIRPDPRTMIRLTLDPSFALTFEHERTW